MTPDRVPKKAVEFARNELRWARDEDRRDGVLYIGEGGVVTEEEWLQMEAEYSAPFIREYAEENLPKNRLIVVDASGQIDEVPFGEEVGG